jgi:hypothetical protein
MKAPVFIGGAHRSGTTMLRLMLNSHPNLAVPNETGFIAELYKKHFEYGDLRDQRNSSRLLDAIADYPLVKLGKLISDREAILAKPIEDYATLVDSIYTTYAECRNKLRWGDKTPSNVLEMGTLWRLFPDCRILHIVRDGRDVALSNRALAWGIPSLPRMANDWRWRVFVGRKVGEVLGDSYFEVRYEDLVLHPDSTLRRVCQFLDIQFSPQMLEYHRSGRDELPNKSLRWHQNSIRPPDPSLVGQWRQKMSISDRTIFEELAGDALNLFGYETEKLPPNKLSRAKEIYYAIRRW